MNKELYNLTYPQKSIWLTEQFYPNTNIGNISGTLTIHEKVDFKILEQALNIFVKNNDSMRIKLTLIENKPKQYIKDYNWFNINIENFDDKDSLAKLETNLANKSFQLLESDLFNFTIFRFPDETGGFIATLHHIISDAWTMKLLIDNVMEYYNKLLSNTNIDSENLFTYKDYIENEIKYINSTKFQKDKEYWEDSYNTCPELSSVKPFDTISNPSTSAKRKSFKLDKNISSSINYFCKNHKTSPFTLFLGIFAIYLGRTSSLDEIIVGTPILNRGTFKEKNTTGMFISNVPFKISIENTLTFAEFLKNISVEQLSLFRHQKYPYDLLLNYIREKFDNKQNLYTTIVSYQNARTSNDNKNTKYSTTWQFNGNISEPLDFHIYDMDNTGEFNLFYDYQTQQFEESEIEEIHNRLICILNTVMNSPDILLKDIEIVTEEEKQKLLYEFNDTKIPYPKDKSISDLFEEQVQNNPDAIALVYENISLTYGELNKKANCLAHYLKNEKNIQQGDKIAIITDKNFEMIIDTLAIIKLGCIYVPVDPEYPQERKILIIKSSNSKIILSHSGIDVPSEFIQLTILTDLNNTDIIYNKKFNYENLKLSLPQKSPAYIMYTSGSTGTPKGAIITQKNIIRLVINPNYIKIDASDRILQTGAIVFDASTFEIWGALLNGAQLHLIKKDNLLNPKKLGTILKENKITILWLTSALFNFIADTSCEIFNNLKYLMSGGDVLSTKHINKVLDLCPNIKIINGYGPTENTTFSTCFEINKKYEKNIPIGKPISNSTCYIVSEEGKLQPIGIPGELWVGGDGVCLGYLNNTQLTSEKFIQNPFIFNDTLYKTGDIVSWLPDGNINFIGRKDKQIKIRGYRVEIDGIENKILTFPNIKQCHIEYTKEDSNGYLVAYITTTSNVNLNSLKAYLAISLPSYMIPSYFMVMDKLPLNTNGKIDRKNLPPVTKESNNSNITLPSTKSEEFIINILKNTLKTNDISITDDLFNLGMDSLSAINIVTTINNKLNIDLGISDIFKYPVIKDLASYIGKHITSNSECLLKTETSDYYPVSYAQKRLYLASKICGNDSLTYNMPSAIIFDDKIDINRLEYCFNELIKRHDILKTYFVSKEGEIFQKIDYNALLNLEIGEGSSKNIDSIIKSFVKPFDLEKAPLFRIKLVYLDTEQILLLFDMHHIISDGTSIQLFIKEMCDIYDGKILPELEMQYKDYAIWENNQINKDTFKANEAYWLNNLSGTLPVLDMPLDFERPVIQNFDGNTIHKQINAELSNKIRLTAKNLNLTPYMLLLSAYYILLTIYANQDDILIGCPIINRPKEETKNMLGIFINNIVLRQKIDTSISFKDFTASVRETCLNAYENQGYPFDLLINKLNIKRDSSRNPLFDTMFVYQNFGMPKIHLGNVEAKFFNFENSIAKFDLCLEIVPNDDIFNLNFEYCTKLFKETSIEKISLLYIDLLNKITNNPDILIKNIDSIPVDDKVYLNNTFNNTQLEFPSNKTIKDLFEAQVEKNSENIAIYTNDTQITFKELSKKANKLANYLKAQNVKNNTVVGVMMNRTPELIISIWAIIKAGGTYLPIYPGLPAERINYILTNSECNILLSSNKIKKSFELSVAPCIYEEIEFEKLNCENLPTISNTNDCLYIIYTSGSTGMPKGVKLSHLNLNNFVHSFYTLFEKHISSKDICLCSTSISFDVSIWEMFFPLIFGAGIFLYEEDTINNIMSYCNCFKDNNITMAYIPPNILNEVSGILKTIGKIKLNKMLVGVESISKNTIKNYFDINSNMKIVNGYGPTECTICATAYKVDKNSYFNYDVLPIGKPLHNNSLYVLNKDLNLCPIGVKGELYISGNNVGLGYINNETLTNENYLDNPFEKNKKMYKTGDLVKIDSTGNLQFIGRNDSQLKISGYRIELGEIENTVIKFPGVRKAVVIPVDKNGRKQLICYFCYNYNVNSNDIKLFLQTKLPYYMIPSYFIQVDELPITPNGKIDKQALMLIEPVYTNSISLPENEIQKNLLDIWKNVLNIENIGIDDNFFEIGGDSMSAIKMQIEIINMGLDISYANIFSHPTIRELSNITAESTDSYDVDSYDYSKINNLLINNSLQNITNSYEEKPIGNVLLLGATGFLGIHILDAILQNNEDSLVYCIVRERFGLSSKERLLKNLNFYFGDKYNSLIDKRIFVITGDITNYNLGLSSIVLNKLTKDIDCIVNSAALVKHYGDELSFQKANILGVKNIIDFCIKYNKYLYHISTLSVSGNIFTEDTFNTPENIFSEKNLYVHQKVDNLYIKSKFISEREILSSIIERGLQAVILRVGNITSRFSDGVFQINVSENAFLNRFKTFIQLGAIPDYIASEHIEFTPVDIVANSILKCINVKHNFCMFHLFNNNIVAIKELLEYFKDLGINIHILTSDEFSTKLKTILKDKENKNLLASIINDIDKNFTLNYESAIKLDSSFTNEFLKANKFEWPQITYTYIKKYIDYLRLIGYIEEGDYIC